MCTPNIPVLPLGLDVQADEFGPMPMPKGPYNRHKHIKDDPSFLMFLEF